MTPATIMLRELADARRAGRSFEDAWPAALAAGVAVARDARERREWSAVLAGMVQTWQAAWERRGASRPERAVSMIAGDPERCVPLPDRECEHCGEEIPEGRRAGARYCSSRCRGQAHEERERVAA